MNQPELQSHIQNLLDENLSVEEFTALESELLENSESLETYRTYVDLHCGLEKHSAFQTAMNTMPVVPVDRVIALQRRRVVKTSLLAAAALLLVSAVALWMNMVPKSQRIAAGFQTAPGSAFVITHTGEGDAPMGDLLVEGSRILLEHGVVELKLPHSVRAIIEAPAAMVLVDDKTLQLDHGRAFFHVPTEAGHGFTVVTPQQRIVDLGTAFGIDLQADRDEVELHVFEGKVRVDSLDGGQGEIIKANRLVLLAGTQVSSELDGPPTAFRRHLPPKIDILVKEDFETGLIVDHNYVIRMDPTVVRDLDGNDFSGIDDDTTWNFTTLPNATAAIITPVSEVATDQFGDWIDTIDGTGLSGGGTSGDILNETHAASGAANFALFPGGPDYTGESMIFTLGARSTVNQVHLWLNTSSWGNISGFDLEFSADGGLTFPATVAGITFDLDRDLTQVQTRTFAEQAGVTHIRLSNVVVTGGDQSYAGFNEIRFGQPESSVDRFTDWIAQFPSVGDQTGCNDDPDGDRLSNGLEFELGTHPGQSTPISDPTLSTSGDSPPVFIAAYPSDDSTGATQDGQLKMLFNEPIKFGTGRVFIQNVTDWSEHMLVAGSSQLKIDDRVLAINPPIGLKDGAESLGWIAGWKSRAPVTFTNPHGDGKWYDNDGLQDDSPSQGIIGSMRSSGMVSINNTIRREIGTIVPDSRYTVSAAIGVRDEGAKTKASFLGCTIRLTSGDTVLAELTDDTPPGPPNSVTSVGFSWDSSTLPVGVNPGALLAIEIVPNQPAGAEPGYLDLDNVRVSVVGE